MHYAFELFGEILTGHLIFSHINRFNGYGNVKGISMVNLAVVSVFLFFFFQKPRCYTYNID